MAAETEQERVWFAREVFTLFVKCFTNLKLYPHDHKHCKDAMSAFTKRLRAFVNLHDVLRISVSKEALTVEEQTVYESEGRGENLAFRLYVDGLREISVNRGVKAEEAAKLAFIFYETITNPDSDSTLLLWEADLTNIDYVAINSLTEAWESPDYFSSDQLDLLDQMNHNVDQIVESLSAHQSRGTYSFELSDGANELERSQTLGPDAAEERDEDEGDIFDVHADALRALRSEALSWGPDRLLKTMVGEALDGFDCEPEIIGADLMRWLLREAVDLALRSHDMDLLAELLQRYEGELALVEEDEAEAVFREVFAWLGRDENLERLVKLATGGSLGGPKAYCRILGAMGPKGLIGAVSTYLQTADKPLREALQAFLIANAAAEPKVLRPLLDPDLPADTVRTGLFIVDKCIRGRALAELLNVARKHADPEITKYATHLWRTNTDEGRVVVLMDALGAESRNDRVKAVQALVEGNLRQGVERLKELIGDKSFLERDAQERGLFIDALRRLGGMGAVAFLTQQTQRKTLIFNRKASKEVREQAAQALADLKAERKKG